MNQRAVAATDKRHVNIQINNLHFKVSEPTLTGRGLATLGGIGEGNQLFLEVPGPEDDRQIGADEVVQLKSGMKFYDVPVGNLG
jgi:hypothetical protein